MSTDTERANRVDAWEYLVIRHGIDFDFSQLDDSEEVLFNRLGQEGWEIVSCLNGIGGHISRVILKRPRRNHHF